MTPQPITHESLLRRGFVDVGAAMALATPNPDLPEHPSSLRLLPHCFDGDEWIVELWNHGGADDVHCRVAIPRLFRRMVDLEQLILLITPEA